MSLHAVMAKGKGKLKGLGIGASHMMFRLRKSQGRNSAATMGSADGVCTTSKLRQGSTSRKVEGVVLGSSLDIGDEYIDSESVAVTEYLGEDDTIECTSDARQNVQETDASSQSATSDTVDDRDGRKKSQGINRGL